MNIDTMGYLAHLICRYQKRARKQQNTFPFAEKLIGIEICIITYLLMKNI